MFGFVCDKLKIPFSELTKENVREKLQQFEVSEGLIGDFMEVMKTCEMALFAGMDNTAAMEESYERSVKVLQGMEL